MLKLLFKYLLKLSLCSDSRI